MTTEGLIDGYTLKARVAPAILAATPALVLGLCALPYLPGLHKLWTLIGLGLTTYAALVARKAGNRVQTDLWARWGGAPTARRLRYSECGIPGEIGRRHREFERALGDAIALPTHAEEASDPSAADAEYQQIVRRLIARVRNKPDYPLLNAENQNYGYARNLLGLKPLGLWCSWLVLGLSLVTCATIGCVASWRAGAPLALPIVTAGTAVILWHQVNAEFVRPSAEAYADRLLEAAQSEAAACP